MNKEINEKNTLLPEIMRDYKKNIQNLIMSITGNRNATDIEQEVYIKIWKNLNRYREQGNLWSWVKRITINTCKDHLKSKQYNNELKTDLDEGGFSGLKDQGITPDNLLLMEERRKLIISAIESLKPKFKEVVILYDMQEMSYEEVSEKIKCPVGTIKSRLFNARKQLQKELEERSILL